MKEKISIVIPAHNEADNCENLLKQIHRAVDSWDWHYEIVYVDDGSDDDSLVVLHCLQQEIPQLRLLRHQQNCGQSTALHTGIRAALSPVIVTLDGDGQNDPADMVRLVQILLENAGNNLRMVAGWRKKRKDSWWRLLSSKIANSVRRFLLKDDTPDTGCGLKAFYREDFLNMPFFDHMHRFLPALIKRQGGEVLSVEVNHFPRRAGRSHYGTLDRLRVGIVDLFGVAWLQRRIKHPIIHKYPDESSHAQQ